MDKQIKLVEKLAKKFKDKVAVLEEEPGTLYVNKDDVLDVMGTIKDKYHFNMLLDSTAVDYEEKMVAVYHLMSLPECDQLKVKVNLEREDPRLSSVVSLWAAANLMERETYDLLGIIYEGHPDLKRVLCSDDFEGHPLRKDYKVEARR
ncbi:NADH-quinone oxidoreductase subunit C [Metallumcola ferriviriculae]|uniref:NADH-quinone oxidoreductase n=1 Tax=Metallumcola ferriviriculae TaxID=3039180 RepID=A0AAU0UMS3_9FIRM|nr:NADH-quinone oxidoreductase subunit C [Desulfitibacteraceae bacterium MK1]